MAQALGRGDGVMKTKDLSNKKEVEQIVPAAQYSDISQQ